MQFFPTAEGYVNVTQNNVGSAPDPGGKAPPKAFYNYVYNYVDHLGNIRLSYSRDPATGVLKIIEENHYYPFGLKHSNYNTDKKMIVKEEIPLALTAVDPSMELKIKPETPLLKSSYNYKYNGKEYQDELGLNTFDYGFRQYMPDIGRWGVVDPLAEQTPNWSPYAFCNNNPLFFTDPTGMSSESSIVDNSSEGRYRDFMNGYDGSRGFMGNADGGPGDPPAPGTGTSTGNMQGHLPNGAPNGVDLPAQQLEEVVVTATRKSSTSTSGISSDGFGAKDVPGLGLDIWNMNVSTNLANGMYVNAAGKLASFENLKYFKPGLDLGEQPALSRAFTNYRALGSTLGGVTKALPFIQLAYSEGSYQLGNKSQQARDDRNFNRVTTAFGFMGPVGWGMGTFLQINQHIPVQYETPFTPGRTQQNWNSWVK